MNKPLIEYGAMLKRREPCPCGCGVTGVPRAKWKGHPKGCPCRMCQAQFPPSRVPESLRSTAEKIAYDKVREDRAVFASGRCEAPDGFHASLCDGHGSQFHHVLPRSKGGADSFDNGRWLNQFCHERVHARPVEAKTVGLLEDPPPDPEDAA